MDSIQQHIEDRLWPAQPPKTRLGRAGLAIGRHAYALASELWTGALSLRAMSLVFTTVIAVVPMLAFSFAVLKGLGMHRQLEPFLLRILEPIGPRADEVTSNVIGFVDNTSGGALASIAIALLLYNVLSMAQKVESSFNYVWRVDQPRSLARRFSDYLSVILIGPVFMSAAMSLLAALTSTTLMGRLRAAEPFGQWIAALGNLLPYLMIIAAFTFLYVFVPNTKVRFKPALAGGVLAGTVWAFGGGLFTSFVAEATRWVVIYSGFAIVLVAMMWIYLSWLILLLGSQFAFYVQHPDYLRGSRIELLSSAVREQLALSVMLLVGRDFSEPSHGWRTESLAAAIGVQKETLMPITEALVDAGLLTHTKGQRLVPARDPRRIGVEDMIRTVRGRPITDLSHDSWGEVTGKLASTIEEAVHAAAGERTLADLVDEEARLRADSDARRDDEREPGVASGGRL